MVIQFFFNVVKVLDMIGFVRNVPAFGIWAWI